MAPDDGLSDEDFIARITQAREDRWQAYFWPGTEVLRNKLGIRQAYLLQELEHRYAKSRQQDLHLDPNAVPRTLDFDHLRGLHRYLFQDVYDWAGELRTVDMQKDRNPFARISTLAETADALFQGIRRNDYFNHLSTEGFAQHGAEVFNELNKLHPFREGNGRTQRLFMEHLAQAAGYDLDLRTVSNAANIEAAVAGMRGELGPYRFLLAQRLTPRAPAITILHCQADKKELTLTMEREPQLKYLVQRAGYAYQGSKSIDHGRAWIHVFQPEAKGVSVHADASRRFLPGVTVKLPGSSHDDSLAARDVVFLGQADASELQTLQRVRPEIKDLTYQQSMSRDGRTWIHIYAASVGLEKHRPNPVPSSSQWVPHNSRIEVDAIQRYGVTIQRALRHGMEPEMNLTRR